ncbi:MAG TPA: 50S ribosomal protein L25 [Pirellulales bacterium]|nr:50S ribosomal protein L25 [Pirellulales bacterium]
MSETLKVEVRESRGKRHARKLRQSGSVPAILYGHGEANLSLSIPLDQVKSAVRHGARVVDLSGAVTEKAFIRDLQWDTYGLEVLHIDLARVSADEKVEVEVTVELRGEAPGAKEGGVVTQLLHQVSVESLVTAIPEKLSLRINSLALNASLTAADIDLPPGTTLVTPGETVVVQCAVPKEEEEGAPLSAEGAEPELIGRKPGEDEESEEG